MAEVDIQLTLISQGSAFLFAIYQLSKGREHIDVAPCKFCENNGTALSNWTPRGTEALWNPSPSTNTESLKSLTLLVSLQEGASLRALSDLLGGEIVQEAAVCLIYCRNQTVYGECGLQEEAGWSMNK